jgi:hypothetical protein
MAKFYRSARNAGKTRMEMVNKVITAAEEAADDETYANREAAARHCAANAALTCAMNYYGASCPADLLRDPTKGEAVKKLCRDLLLAAGYGEKGATNE